MQKCYYEILQVSKSATGAEIKRSYRKLAMKYHPDRNQNNKKAELKFKEVSEAYEILSDPQKRTAYDQFGHAGVNGNAGAGGFNGGSGSFSNDAFSDIFENFFGGGSSNQRSGRKQSRGSDLEYEIHLTLEEVFNGVEKEIKISAFDLCDKCDGTGSKSKTTATCNVCHGAGKIRQSQGFFAFEQTCPACNGSGENISNPCDNCHGQGRVKTTKNINIKIPAGVDNGDRIRLQSKGDKGQNGATNGDLYIQVFVKENSFFTRRGADLFCEVPICFTTACLGGEVNVPTIDGTINLKISAETQTGKHFRVRDKGMSILHGHHRGDLICTVKVETPINLSNEQKELLEKFAESLGDSSNGKHSPTSNKSWFSNLKDHAKQFFE